MKETFAHKKSLGQHFLNSPVVPRWMCDAAGDIAGRTVFEIGPGTGILTREILARGATVVALEADQRALEVLEGEFTAELASGQLRLHHGDARSIDFSTLGLSVHAYICIANIPYYLSGHLFRTLLESHCQPSDLVFLTQKEVAQRIARDPKESILSLSVKAYGEPKYEKTVTAGHFSPPPAIDSAIISIHNINKARFTSVSEKNFFEIIHLGFAAKRKQLLGNLAKQFDRTTLTAIFNQLDIDSTIRGEDVPLDMWLALAEYLTTHN